MIPEVRPRRIYRGFLFIDMHSLEKQLEHSWNSIIDMNWSWDDRFNKVFLKPEDVNVLMMHVSLLRKHGSITPEERVIILEVIRLGRKRYLEYKEHIYNAPRREAQKYIGNKKIRRMIFNRDGNKCLRCGDTEKLTIDHINPVAHGGENKLINLQTLCRSCNSWKGVKFIDFRNYGKRITLF